MASGMNRLRIRELEKRIDQRFAAVERALDIAAAESRAKGAAANEWRAENQDLTATFARREYLDGQMQAMRAEIEPLKLSKALLEGKASAMTANGALLLSVLSLLVSFVTVALAYVARP